MPTSSPRTLADQLRGWPAERLARLLETRPDLASPAPRDSAQLAARAVVRTSVLRTLEDLDRFDLTVLDALAQGVSDAGALREVVNAEPDAVAASVERLTDRALAWGPADRPRATAMVAELLALPSGPAPEQVPALLAELDERSRAMLDHLDTAEVDGSSAQATRRFTRESARTPVEQLLARRLLVARGERSVAIPWTVRLALRGGHSTRERVDVLPEPATSPREQRLVDHTAAGAAFELVRRTGMLLEQWGSQPPGALRAGGLGVREVKAAAQLLHVDPDLVTLLVETAAAAGLLDVGRADDIDAAWLPTDTYDGWQARPAAQRWERLARAWLASPRLLPGTSGPTDSRTGKPANALAPGLEQPWVARQRRAILTELLVVEPGRTLAPGTGVASFVERLRWRQPRLPEGRLLQVEQVLHQATQLGIVAFDGLSSFGRALLTGADAADALEPHLPTPLDHLLLQADLTAIAPGPLTQELARRVAMLAEVESRGGATVYRFSATSVRRAFDAGWSAAEIHEFLGEVSRTPVPQALSYLVDDVARRFGTVRAGHAEAFLRSEDEVALAELVHHPQAAALRLRRIAPTVAVTDVPLQTLLPRLRELGVAPVVEAPDGTVHVARPDVFRSRTPKVAVASARAHARTAAQVAAVVTAVRSGDRAAAEQPRRGPASTPADVVTLLRAAIEGREQVLIGYLDNHGTATQRRVRPERVEGGRLTAYDERSDDVRDFAIHRITTAAPVGR